MKSFSKEQLHKILLKIQKISLIVKFSQKTIKISNYTLTFA